MKKILIIFMIISTITQITYAAEIPRKAVSLVVIDEQMLIAEALISDVLDEVQNGMGYGQAKAQANNILRTAVINNKTNGYGFGVLSGISNNAILLYRDMYLRKDFYIENEKVVKSIIADVITKYENNEIDYPEVVKRSYEKIYQSVNPAFNYDEQYAVDSCYRDIPPIDNAMFTIARKLILESKR